jgi:hypothetical protein
MWCNILSPTVMYLELSMKLFLRICSYNSIEFQLESFYHFSTKIIFSPSHWPNLTLNSG